MNSLVRQTPLVGITVPVHWVKFYYAFVLSQSFKKIFPEQAIRYVFSSSFELYVFSLLFRTTNIKSSIYNEDTLSTKGIISQKKFYGVISEFSSNPSVKYICVLDSESIAYKSSCLFSEFHSLYSTKCFKANYSDKGGKIIENICKTLGDHIDYNYLREVTHNFRLYWWMNDACIYERKDFLDFHSWLLLLPMYKQIIDDYWSFDYLLYSIYLINYKSFKLTVPLDGSSWFEFGAIESDYSPQVAKSFDSLIDCVHDYNHTTRALFKVHIDTFPSSSIPSPSYNIKLWRLVICYLHKVRVYISRIRPLLLSS